jgi:ribosomal protein L11 methyltransferase
VLIDDLAATAIEEQDDIIRIFFATSEARAKAERALQGCGYAVETIDVDDEDWARRSQQDLKAITVGRLTIAPQPLTPGPHSRVPTPHSQVPTSYSQVADSPLPIPSRQPLTVIIQPSMGFGTGHHATTRLCLRALQELDLSGRFVLDVGTGSGILAIAAIRLGAARALGIDADADAVAAAHENLRLNPGVGSVEFRVADLSAARLSPSDVVVANLTGGQLIRCAALLRELTEAGGVLIASGFLDQERDEVVGALCSISEGPDGGSVEWEQTEDGWSALAFRPKL